MADHFNEFDISHMFEVFRQYDPDFTGRLHLKDLAHAMLALGHNPTNDELAKLVQGLDKEPERMYIDFTEFLTVLACHLQELEPEEQLREAFKVFDKDGNGRLNADELKRTMNNFGERLSKEDIDYMIKMADTTGDGQVNYEDNMLNGEFLGTLKLEFIKVMTSK